MTSLLRLAVLVLVLAAMAAAQTQTRKKINDACTRDNECRSAVSNSHCSSGNCTCNAGYHPNANLNRCIKRKVNDTCTFDEDCSAVMPGSECADDTKECVCSAGFIANEKFDQCVQRKLNENCTVDNDCSAVMPYSECTDDTNVCACSAGFSANDKLDKCARLQIGSACKAEKLDCAVAMNNSLCNLNTSKCECDSKFLPNQNNTECVPLHIKDPCTNDSQCLFGITNSLCAPEDGRCACVLGYRGNLDGTACVPRLIGDECTVDDDCSLVNISECAPDDVGQKRCHCDLGFIQTTNNSACVPIRITDPCKKDEDCSASVNDSVCVENHCECIQGWRSASQGQQCIKRQAYDDCSVDLDCSAAVANSECSSFQCVCLIGYQMSRDLKSCTKSVCLYPSFVAHAETASEGRKRDSAATIQSCSRVCLEKNECDGFDWEHGSQSGSQCWLTGTSWTTRQRHNVKGITHFYRKCAACPEYEFLETTEDPEEDLGFVHIRATTTIEDCKDACVSKLDCTGLEWSTSNPSGYQCWLTGPRLVSGKVKPFGTRTPYHLDCKENVMYALRLTPQQVTLGNVLNAAKTVVDCSAACLGTIGCDGFDWTESNNPGLQCWLSGPWTTGTERVDGGDTVHYALHSTMGGRDPWAAASKPVLSEASASNPCKMNPCLNGGKCKPGNRPGTFLCGCEGRWTGSDCSITTADPSTAEEELIRTILGDADDDIRTLSRPFVKFSDLTEIQFAVLVNKVIELDELQEMMEVGLQYDISWKDNRLSWNKIDHANITHVNLPTEKIWTPDILVVNSALEDGVRVGGGADERAKKLVRVKNNGKCYWRTLSVITTHCRIGVKDFPFDMQVCSLKFQVFHPKHEVKLNTKGLYKNDGYAPNQDYKDDGEWELTSTEIIPGLDPENYSYHLEIKLHLSRKSFYYVLNFVIPCFTFSVIGAMTFLLPADSGDRIGLGVSLLLGITVYQMIINDKLPATSDTIPLLGVYFLFVMITCAVSIGMFIVVTALHQVSARMPKKINIWLVKIAPYLLVKPAQSSTDKAEAASNADEDEKKEKKEEDDVEKQKTAANGRMERSNKDSVKSARDSFFGVEASSTTDRLLQAMLTEMKKTRELTEELKAELKAGASKKDKESDEAEGDSGDADSGGNEEWLLMARVIDRMFFILTVICFFIGTVHFFANSASAKPHLPPGIDE